MPVIEQVRATLADDYPPEAISWLDRAEWRGPVEVALDLVDWAEPLMISADPAKVEHFAAKITRRRRAGKRVKPVVMVQTPQRVLVVDGHHRALAFRHLGVPVTGYVGAVEADAGPWLTTHAQQLVDEVETHDAA